MTSQANEMEVTRREQESGNGKAYHHRKGGSLSCVPLHISSWPFVSPAAEHTLSAIVFSLNSPDSSSSLSSVQSQSRLMSALYWLCGMERRKEGDNDPVTPPAPEQAVCSLEEKPHLRLIVNANLIICLSVTVFIIGYWGWQAGYDTLNGHMVHRVACGGRKSFLLLLFVSVIKLTQ